MRSFDEVDRLTLAEYDTHIKAILESLKEKERDMYLIAWLSVAAKATRKNGSPVYDRFEKFYKESKKEMKAPDTKIRRLRKYYEEGKNNG